MGEVGIFANQPFPRYEGSKIAKLAAPQCTSSVALRRIGTRQTQKVIKKIQKISRVLISEMQVFLCENLLPFESLEEMWIVGVEILVVIKTAEMDF